MGGECGGAGECGGCSGGATASRSFSSSPPVCIKCKQAPAAARANQTEPVCAQCLRSSVYAKLKTVLTTHAQVTARDKILVAFSGGFSSRVAVEILSEIRADAMASRSPNALSFELGVAFVDESLAFGVSEEDSQHIKQEIQRIVSGVPLHIGSLEDTFDEESNEKGRLRLRELLDSVTDTTGREDLIEILRMELLNMIAEKHNYTKLVLGSNSTRIATRIIAATAKGQGRSLTAGVEYFDGRWHAPVILPLRDCAAKELALFCHFFGLETLSVRGFNQDTTINSLCSRFVMTLREENPARDHTIVRTAGKLTSFNFNKAPESDSNSRRRPKRTSPTNHTDQPELLCTLCRSPLGEYSSRDNGYSPGEYSSGDDGYSPGFCSSCEFQILSGKGVVGLLPAWVRNRHLMEAEIRDYLILDDTI